MPYVALVCSVVSSWSSHLSMRKRAESSGSTDKLVLLTTVTTVTVLHRFGYTLPLY
jgi:hypothetical protein